MLQFLAFLLPGDACTMWASGKKATETGATLIVGSDDGEGTGDPRIVHVPPMDWPAGSKRPVYFGEEDYPRYTGRSRGPAYYPKDGETAMKPIGYIDQVPHTYGRYEGDYGIINEKNVAIVESSTSSKLGAAPRKPGEDSGPIWSIDELTRVALERADNAKDAVLLMGKLAVEGGFYGAGTGNVNAEALFVSDPNEVWLFHVLPAPKRDAADGLLNRESAVWVAKRVPDDGVMACPNVFVIRGISGDDALHSDNVFGLAQTMGFWDGSSAFDFTKVWGKGEYCQHGYAGRRAWRIMSLVAPSLDLDGDYINFRLDAPYPESVTPDEPVTLRLASRIMRDYYNATKYDLSEGLAAGPFSSPLRLATPYDCSGNETSKGNGGFERSIGIHRTAYSVMVEIRGGDDPTYSPKWAGRAWIGQHAAWGTVYVPFYGMATASEYSFNALPPIFSTGSPFNVSETMWWASRRVSNVMYSHWNKYRPIVEQLQNEMEDGIRMELDNLEASLPNNADTSLEDLMDLIKMTWDNAALVAKTWSALSSELILLWGDGYGTNPQKQTLGQISGYSKQWLRSVGYYTKTRSRSEL